MPRPTTRKKIEDTQAQATLDAVKTITADTVVNEIGKLQVGLQGTLANLSSVITSKIEQMNQVDQAIALKKDTLKTLHDVEAEVISLDDIRTKRETEDQDWARRFEDRKKLWKEEEDERTKKWMRDREQHDYNFEINKRNVFDHFDAEMKQKRKDEDNKAELLAKNWKDREDFLAAREKELADLKTFTASMEDRVKAEVAKAEAITKNVVTKHYEHQIALMQKDAEAEKNMENTKGQAAATTIAGLQSQIKSLNDQLEKARTDAREVTAQALQSASHRQVAEALQRVVDVKEPSAKGK